MASVITVVLPVFAVIALGYLAGRFGYFAADAVKPLNDYTFGLAVPAFMFRSMARLEIAELPTDLWISFFGAAAFTWVAATIITATMLERPADHAPSIAMSSSFGNVVMLGLPLSIAAFGETAAAPAALIVALHTPMLLMTATIHQIATTDKGKSSVWSVAQELVLEMVRSPIILSILAGILWRATGIGLHPAVDRVLFMLAQSAIATSLVGLGLSLVGLEIRGQTSTLATIIALKLIVMPMIAWLLAVQIIGMAPVAAGVAVLFAAMPTGANAYLFASRTGRAVNSASGAVALGTILSVITTAIAVSILGGR